MLGAGTSRKLFGPHAGISQCSGHLNHVSTGHRDPGSGNNSETGGSLHRNVS